jgi:hemerythrin-like domain-containing protein
VDAFMKATSLLEKQHRQVESLFRKLERGKADATSLVIELANDLAAHMVIEEELFYPAAKAVDRGMVLESYEEHAIAAYALQRLIAADPADPSFLAKVTALRELILQHVDEEESRLFPRVERGIDAEDLDALGKQMKARFDRIVEAGYERALSLRTPVRVPPRASASTIGNGNGHRAREARSGARAHNGHRVRANRSRPTASAR